MLFEIRPEYKKRKALKAILFSAAFALVFVDLLIKHVEGFIFFALIPTIIGTLITAFAPTSFLAINKDKVQFETKSLAQEPKLINIDLTNIKDVRFLKRQMLWLGGRNPIADADAQTLYHENRIVFTLLDDSKIIIQQVGKLKDFKTAFALVEKRLQ